MAESRRQIAAAAWLLICWPQIARSSPAKPGAPAAPGQRAGRRLDRREARVLRGQGLEARHRPGGGSGKGGGGGVAGRSGTIPAAYSASAPGMGRGICRPLRGDCARHVARRSPRACRIATACNAGRFGNSPQQHSRRRRAGRAMLQRPWTRSPISWSSMTTAKSATSSRNSSSARACARRRPRCEGGQAALAAGPLPSGGARPDAARRRRARLRHMAAQPGRRADRHADRDGRRDRPHRRPGAWRRRLSRQAVQPARAAGPGPRGAAPRRAARPARRRNRRPRRCASVAGPWSRARRRLLNPDGAEVPLTGGEYELLQVLVERPIAC